MIDQKALIISGPNLDGLWDRGTSGSNARGPYPGNTCPINGFTESLDIRYFPWGCKTRQGYLNLGSIAGSWTNIRQVVAYNTNKLAGASTTVISGYLVVSGTNIYDSLAPVPSTAIAAIGATDYISIVTLFGRIYITEHDFNTSDSIATPIVYFPATGGAARNIAGTPTALGAATFVSSATAGNVVTGTHVFGVTFETNSGHIMGISSANVGAFNILGVSKSVDAAVIPLGPAGTTKRHIVASKVITGYSGDPTDYEVFFVAEIPNNVATTLTFNFTDESLVDSADYLYEIQATPLPGLGFIWYSERLISWGEDWFNTSNLGPSYLRVSEKGKPEAYSDTVGFVSVYPDDGQYGIKVAFEQEGLLVICKENKTYVTRDNGGDPNTWQVDALDATIGSTVFGVTKSLDTTGAAKSGKTVVVSRPGVYLFQGQFLERPLSWKIERRWKTFSEDTSFLQAQIIDIAQVKLFVIAVGDTNSGLVTKLAVCDYSRGLNWQDVRWSIWDTFDDVNFITLPDYKTLYFCSGVNTINYFVLGTNINDYPNGDDDNDAGHRITPRITTAELKFDDILNRYQIVQARLRGFAGVQTVETTDYTVDLTIGDDTLSATDGSGNNIITRFAPVNAMTSISPEVVKSRINFSGYYPRISITWSGQLFELRQLVISGKVSSEDKL